LLGLLLRRVTSLLFCLVSVWGTYACCNAEALRLSAQRIAFYYDRFIVTGDGNVSLRMDDGSTLNSRTFYMDLRSNRFMLAGGVHFHNATYDLDGAAFSDFLDFKRVYFVPVTDSPDRWTFINGDYGHPKKGREMPGDTFYLPDVSADHVFLYAKTAIIRPGESAQFNPATINVGIASIPTPGYFLNFSPNPNLAANSLSGAYFDGPYNFAGSKHSLSTLHFRYDQINKAFVAFEQHLATDKSYAVFSVNPLNRARRQFNLGLYDQLSPTLQIHTFTELFTDQSGFSQPRSSGQFTTVQLTQALQHSFVQLNGHQYNTNLLAASSEADAHHPFDSQLIWTGYNQRLPKTPLTYRLRSGLDYYHDAFGVQEFGGVNYTTQWATVLGVTLYSPSFKVGERTYLNASFDKQRQTFQALHHIDESNFGVSLSHTIGTKAAMYLSYNVRNLGDYYGSSQLTAYPVTVPVSPFDGRSYPGYAAFRGFGTFRSVTGSLVLTPNPNFGLSLGVQKNNDFPAPIPQYVGSPPYVAFGDVRIRLSRTLQVDVSRQYYFNFGNQRWSPQFGILFGP